MANRTESFGMDVAISRKLNSKYDLQSERDVVGWIQALTGQQIQLGRENVYAALKTGQILVKLMNFVLDGTQNLPPQAQRIRRPIKFTTMTAPFKQMENIDIFLAAAEAYGVPRASLFQTVDLFECRNMAQVLNTILQVGTECQRNGFNGPTCGPKPTYENKRQFTSEQMRSGQGTLSLQSGSNQHASQKGMSMGAVRHIADIRCDDFRQESNGIISLQMGTNQFASQKGMSIGATRHIADIRCDDVSRSSQGSVGLQMGTNQFASQKGMRMGGVRHIADIKCDDMCQEGQGTISLQYGTNQCASQTGMSMGGQRHIADIRCEDMNREGQGTIGLQMGLSQNQAASQSGMSFGAQRHIMDNH